MSQKTREQEMTLQETSLVVYGLERLYRSADLDDDIRCRADVLKTKLVHGAWRVTDSSDKNPAPHAVKLVEALEAATADDTHTHSARWLHRRVMEALAEYKAAVGK